MAQQIAIPCLFMRGGTSKGPYFNLDDLPASRAARDRVLLAVMGSPDPRQIDGLGGTDTLTSKVAVVGRSSRPGVDVDYYFCQVDITKPIVDTSPPCGNMLAGVAPFAIETGMVAAQDGTTAVVIYDINIDTLIEAVVQTPGGRVDYDGPVTIDGVPGSAAGIALNFLDVAGSTTGKILPTGHLVDVIDGVALTAIDVAMPMIHLRATDLGLTGTEAPLEMNANRAVLARIEQIRLQAGVRMGLGDVTDMVIPKVGLLSPPRHGGTITSRYLTPHKLHGAHAVTGGISVASGCLLEGSIAHGLATPPAGSPSEVRIEHPSGHIDLRIAARGAGTAMEVERAGVMRTARAIMWGRVMISAAILSDSVPVAA